MRGIMSTNGFVCFLIGIASGAAAGLLLSPGSGRDNRHWLAERGYEGAGRVIGEERVEHGRRVATRGKEAAGFAKDSVGMIKRGAKLGRPLEEE
jgi:gas vesicle protein